MKSTVRRLARVRHAVVLAVLLSVAAVLAGLYQAHVPLMLSGIVLILLSVATLAATYQVQPALEGEIVEQRPQLTDAQAHMRRAKELPRAV